VIGVQHGNQFDDELMTIQFPLQRGPRLLNPSHAGYLEDILGDSRTPEYPYGTQIAADEGLSGQKSANLSGHDLGPLWGIKKGQKLSGLLIWVPNSRIFFLTTQGIAKITQFLVFYCLVL